MKLKDIENICSNVEDLGEQIILHFKCGGFITITKGFVIFKCLSDDYSERTNLSKFEDFKVKAHKNVLNESIGFCLQFNGFWYHFSPELSESFLNKEKEIEENKSEDSQEELEQLREREMIYLGSKIISFIVQEIEIPKSELSY